MRYSTAATEVGNTLEVANQVSKNLPKTLSRSSVLLFQVMYALALEKACKEGYCSGVTHVTLHSSLMGICKTVGISRMQGSRLLKILKEAGLIDYRVQKGSLFNRAVNTGIVVQIRMNLLAGSKPRLSYQDLKHSYRDMNRDYKSKRLCSTLISQMLLIVPKTISTVNFKLLVDWSLTPFTTSNTPVSHIGNISSRVGLEAVHDAFQCAPEKINLAVDEAARALAQALQDAASINYYRRLLWQLQRRFKATGEDFSYQVYLCGCRARTDVLEGFARKGGAVFTKRLKEFAWYQEMMEAPPTRIGTRPS